MALEVKNLRANAGEMGVRLLGLEDPLEKGMATYPNILAKESSMALLFIVSRFSL